MATRWHFLTLTQSAQGAVIKGLDKTHVLRRNLARSVTSSPLNRNLSWSPPPIGRGRNIRRRLAPPPVDPSTVTVLGQVESGKGESSDRGEMENLISKLNFYKLISYLVDRCICPARCRPRQTLEKNASSWALARTGSVLFTRQVAV